MKQNKNKNILNKILSNYKFKPCLTGDEQKYCTLE